MTSENHILNNLNKYFVKKNMYRKFRWNLYLLIYVSWSTFLQAYLIVYIRIKVYIFKF